jgi:hypothetical protein
LSGVTEAFDLRGDRQPIVCANRKDFMIESDPGKLAARADLFDMSSLSIDVQTKTARMHRLSERSHTTLKNSLIFFGLFLPGVEGMNEHVMLQIVPSYHE